MTVREMMARMRDLTDNGYGDLEVKYGTPVEFAWLIVDSGEPIEIQLSTRSAIQNDSNRDTIDEFNNPKFESYNGYCYYEWILKERIKNDEQNTVM